MIELFDLQVDAKLISILNDFIKLTIRKQTFCRISLKLFDVLNQHHNFLLTEHTHIYIALT